MNSGRKPLVKATLFIVLCSWLAYTLYWFFKIVRVMPQAFSTYTYPIESLLEVVGTSGLGIRTGAALAAILAIVYLLRGKEASKVVKLIGLALVLEALYFLCFIPSGFFGFQAGFGLTGGHTLISGQEGGLWFIIETGIPALVEAIIMPASLLKLRSKLASASKSHKEIFKWASVVGVFYLIVFWLTYVTQWIATFIQPEGYASTYPGFGMKYILDYPLNMFSFLITSVGLPLLMIFFVWSVLSAIRDPAAGLDLRRVGMTLTLLGGYFITIITLFYAFGYVGGPSVWIVFFIFNNPDLWCVTLPALGITMILEKPTLCS